MARKKKTMAEMNHQPNCQCPPCRGERGDVSGPSPRISVRLRPDIKDWIMNHPEGPRGYLTRLVEEDRKLQEELSA